MTTLATILANSETSDDPRREAISLLGRLARSSEAIGLTSADIHEAFSEMPGSAGLLHKVLQRITSILGPLGALIILALGFFQAGQSAVTLGSWVAQKGRSLFGWIGAPARFLSGMFNRSSTGVQSLSSDTCLDAALLDGEESRLLGVAMASLAQQMPAGFTVLVQTLGGDLGIASGGRPPLSGAPVPAGGSSSSNPLAALGASLLPQQDAEVVFREAVNLGCDPAELRAAVQTAPGL